jgi:hypothetical protein
VHSFDGGVETSGRNSYNFLTAGHNSYFPGLFRVAEVLKARRQCNMTIRYATWKVVTEESSGIIDNWISCTDFKLWQIVRGLKLLYICVEMNEGIYAKKSS